ncbi:uncharacterized protein LOC134212787 [Armigeres subalbatus]|uniref:uncharacterized protein LOC134212787 n=1 Tax=Armigeres subalbatus TaxID=124917 RepID=UPI002ED0EDE2
MHYWPVNMEALKCKTKKPTSTNPATPESLAELALGAYVSRLATESKENSTVEVEYLPTRFIIDALEMMCEYPKLVNIQRQLLTNPWVISRILKDGSNNQTKLVKCFQWLEVLQRSIVSDMVANYCYQFRKTTIQDDSHPLGYEASLRLGTFLSESGWHTEAVKVLNVARHQAEHRPLQQLKAMRPQLISQTYMWHTTAFDTSMAILTLITSNPDLPKPFVASLYLAISICRFESYSFELSHEFALKAFELLDEETSTNRLIIEVFAHLAKTCIPQKKTREAKLMITQAVSRAWHKFGSPSVIYARALEDYAFYLVMMNALYDSYTVFSEAVNVLLQVYGPQNLQRSVTKGNLSFDYYFNCVYIYSDLQLAKEYVRSQIELNVFDHRMVAAAKQVYALLEASTARFGENDEDCNRQRDEYQPIQTQLSVATVKRLFRELK